MQWESWGWRLTVVRSLVSLKKKKKSDVIMFLLDPRCGIRAADCPPQRPAMVFLVLWQGRDSAGCRWFMFGVLETLERVQRKPEPRARVGSGGGQQLLVVPDIAFAGLLVGHILTTKTGLAPKNSMPLTSRKQSLCPLPLLTFFPACLVLGERIGVERGGRYTNPTKHPKVQLQFPHEGLSQPGVLSCQRLLNHRQEKHPAGFTCESPAM